ncbi:helix-turn-helix domain-containing protein [Streptomyces sp. NPDC051555]|uniref:helix-turn-helix domain-containing protein n=1 Tax=Streptomyces sp. NPDC051555 TaxID=3365657 RepID=UPI0037B60231
MAPEHPSAASRASSRLPAGTPRSGVFHVKVRHSSEFVVVGNHLAQNYGMSLMAIGLATHIQSLPTGAPVGIKRLAGRFREGEVRIASALRELEAHGYLERVRVRLETGQVITRTVSYNQPGAAYPEGATTDHVPPLFRAGAPTAEPEPGPVPDAEPPPEPEAEPDAEPDPEPDPEPQGPAPEPGSRPASRLTSRSGSRPASRPRSRGASLGPLPGAGIGPVGGPGCGQGGGAAGPVGAGGVPAGQVRQEAFDLLAELRLRDPRLLLPERAVRQLAPEVSGWLDLGVEPEAVAHLLAGNLPAELGNPAALIGYRLRAQVPPRLPAPRGAPPTARPDPFQTCDGCERAFRAPVPGGYCRDCGPVAQRAA